MMSLSGLLIGAATRLSRAREESWDEQTLQRCQSGTPYEPAALHDPPRTDNPKDQGSLDCSWGGVGGALFWKPFAIVSSYGLSRCQYYHDATAADKRMAVLSHLAVWWCSSRRAPLGRFGYANERCRSKTIVR